MPVYQTYRRSAFLSCILYCNSLPSLTWILCFSVWPFKPTLLCCHGDSSTLRVRSRDAVELAYKALKQSQRMKSLSFSVAAKRDEIGVDLVREALGLVRPHYNAQKTNALVEIVAPSNQTTVDFVSYFGPRLDKHSTRLLHGPNGVTHGHVRCSLLWQWRILYTQYWCRLTLTWTGFL